MGVYPVNQQQGWYSMLYGGEIKFSDVQVINIGGNHNKVIQMTGNKKGDVHLSKTLTVTNRGGWNYYQVEFDFYTGGAITTSNQPFKIFLQSGLIVLAGLEVNMGNLKVTGWGNYNPGVDPEYNKSYKLGPNDTDVYLAPNTWYRLGFSFNKGDGMMIFKDKSGVFDATINGAAAGEMPDTFFAEIEYKSNSTVNPVAVIDNVSLERSTTNTLLLGLEKNEMPSDTFSVSPNPANNFVTISNLGNKNISSVLISDITGRVIKEFNFENNSGDMKILVSDLISGLYILKIISEEGYVVKKIIKE